MSNPLNKGRRIDPKRDVITFQQAEQIEQNRLFFNKLKQTPIVTVVLLITITVFWLISIGSSLLNYSGSIVDWISSLPFGTIGEHQSLLKLGAKVNFFIDNGQEWRFVSPIFLHFGLLHILFNGYALYLLGRMIENIYGKRRFLLIFFISGISSIVASYLASPNMSVGASGAIFGLIGAATVAGFKHKDEIPPVFQRFFGRGMLPWIVLNLSLGLFIEGIDNYAHVGGLIAGTIVTMSLRAKIDSKHKTGWIGQLSLSVAALFCLLVMIGTIVNMLGNLSTSGILQVPSAWKEVKNPEYRLSAKVPETLVALDINSSRGSQYVERHTGFWVALEVTPNSKANLDNIMDNLWEEINNTPEIDGKSVEFLSNELAILGGHAARRVHMSFLIGKKVKVRTELEVWIAPTDKGVVSATCSAPEDIYPMFRLWCKEFITSVSFTDL